MVAGGSHRQIAGTWSDDTSLAIATAKSLKDNGGKIDLLDIRMNFELWLYEGWFTPYGRAFGIGTTTFQALQFGYGLDDFDSNGNGSLMRILPLAFVDCTDDDIKAVSSITHAHDISMEACVHFVHICKNVLNGDTLQEAIDKEEYSGMFRRVPGIVNVPEEDIYSSGYVLDSFEAALWCVATTDNYSDCVLTAVNLGGDTDTIAAIAGGLAGCMYNIFDEEQCPKKWIDILQSKYVIDDCLF